MEIENERENNIESMPLCFHFKLAVVLLTSVFFCIVER